MDIKYAKYKNHAKYTENIKYNKQAKCTQDLSAGRKGLETIQGNRFPILQVKGSLQFNNERYGDVQTKETGQNKYLNQPWFM